MTYNLTREQLAKLLNDAHKMRDEFRDVHGYDDERAQSAATLEILDGLDAMDEIKKFEQVACDYKFLVYNKYGAQPIGLKTMRWLMSDLLMEVEKFGE